MRPLVLAVAMLATAPSVASAEVRVRLMNGSAIGMASTFDRAGNAPRSTFRRWMHGSEPLYGYAEAILRLHSLACGEDKTQMRLAEFRERATRHPS